MDPDNQIMACILCSQFQSSKRPEMKRHVAVVHGEGTFSTLTCDRCQRKYYDYDLFADHAQTSPACKTGVLTVKPERLPDNLRVAFDALVGQMMVPRIFRRSDNSGRSHDRNTVAENDIRISGAHNYNEKERDKSTSMTMTSSPSDSVSKIASATSTVFKTAKTEEAAITGVTMESSDFMDDDDDDVQILEEAVCEAAPSDLSLPRRSKRLETSQRGGDVPIKLNGAGPAGQDRKRRGNPEHQRGITSDHSDHDYEGSTQIPKSPSHEVGKEFRPLSSSAVSNKSRERQNRCRLLIDQCSESGKMTCNSCSQQVLAIFSDGTRNCAAVIRHVFMHLDVAIYHCLHCEQSGDQDAGACKSMYQIARHLRIHHRCLKVIRDNTYADDSDKYHEKIMISLDMCFGRIAATRPKSDDHESTARPAASTYGRALNRDSKKTSLEAKSTLFAERRSHCTRLLKKFAANGKIECQLCCQKVRVPQSVGLGTMQASRHWGAAEHAILHLGKPLFQCRQCGEVKKTRNQIYHHLRDHHSVKGVTAAMFIDRSDQYHKAIMSTLSKCYCLTASEDPKSRSAVLADQQRRAGRATSGRECRWETKKWNGSPGMLYRKRSQYAYRLISKFASSKHQIRCQVCSSNVKTTEREVGVEQTRCRQVVEHALTHSTSLVYECRHCGEGVNCKQQLSTHLSERHKIGRLTGSYMDRSDEHHDDIMNILARCYDRKESSTNYRTKMAPPNEGGLGLAPMEVELTSMCHDQLLSDSYRESQENKSDSCNSKSTSLFGTPQYDCPHCGKKIGNVTLFRLHVRLMHRI